jgi:ABC-type Zn uptake system ZnuABC Zn-binding protein ZnuA
LKIVVTTTFIGDVLHQIAGDIPEITMLLEPGQNPHSYQPTPQDMVKISEANVIFVNGFDLEEFLDDLLVGTETEAEVIVVSEGIQPLGMSEDDHLDETDHEGEDHEGEDHEGEDHEHGVGYDPHVWFDPNNLIIWTENIVDALSELDPDHASDYQANGQNYQEKLLELDSWIQSELKRIPEENRKLVTDHTLLGYFADQYDFTQVGAVIPALTTEVESSGQELAGLIDTIRTNQVKAVFIGIDFDPTLAKMVVEETGIELVPLYFGSLSDGEPAGTYLDFMRYDVNAIISALE